MRVGSTILILVALLRIEMIFNPLGVRFEIFNNKATYSRLEDEAAGRPIIFSDSYAIAAKYGFYTGAPAYCESNIFYRTHQWQYRSDDRAFTGLPALIELDSHHRIPAGHIRSISLPNGEIFFYVEDPDFHPTREVTVSTEGLPKQVQGGDMLDLHLRITNPYPYDITVDGNDRALVMLWRAYRKATVYPFDKSFTIPANGTTEVDVRFVVADELAGKRHEVGFAFRKQYHSYWFNGKPSRVEVLEK